MDNQTLYSIVLTLMPTQHIKVETLMKYQAHTAVMEALTEVDPELAGMFYVEKNEVHPYTLSPLQGILSPRNGRMWLSPDQDYWLRFTFLRTALFERFMDCFLKVDSRLTMRLGDAELLVTELLTTPDAHCWSRHTTWSGLIENARCESEVTIHFESPTAFGFGEKLWNEKVALLPEAEYVFSSLTRSWNQLAPGGLEMDEDEILTYARKHIFSRPLGRLESRVFQFQRPPQVGFVGQVIYNLIGPDEVIRRKINLLADFAFYAGVGMKTTKGMGQCYRVTQR